MIDTSKMPPCVIPDWFEDFLWFYNRPERPALGKAINQYTASVSETTVLPHHFEFGNILWHYINRNGPLTNRRVRCLRQVFEPGDKTMYCPICAETVSVKIPSMCPQKNLGDDA